MRPVFANCGGTGGHARTHGQGGRSISPLGVKVRREKIFTDVLVD
jgi:hypothetical protein